MKKNLDASWDTILSDIKEKLNDAEFYKWIKDLKILTFESNIITLKADNKFIKSWVEDKYLTKLKSALKEFYHLECDIKIVLSDITHQKKAPVQGNSQIEITKDNTDVDYYSVQLNKDYTFNTFVAGKSNQFAFSICKSAAEGFDKLNNPIYIYGDVGLGKTHLMHAVGNQIRLNFPKKRVFCITGQLYKDEFLTSLKKMQMDSFKEKYSAIDVLLFDDVEKIVGGAGSTMEEFFFLFSKLYSDEKQIIITSNALPEESIGMDKRLKSRFAGGLIAHIGVPSVDEKVTILKSFTTQYGRTMSDEILYYLAENIKSDSTRDLIGAANSAFVQSKFHNVELTIEFLQNNISSLLIKRDKTLTPQDIIDIISEYFRIKLVDLKSPSRSKNIVIPRNLAIYLIYKNTPSSLKGIGEIFNRDHSTIKNSISKIEQDIENNDLYTVNTLNELSKKMKIFSAK